MSTMRIYESVFVLHPELSEEDVESSVNKVVALLEGRGAEIICTERGGKRRLAYVVKKQRYGYYNLVHFRAEPGILEELERVYRLDEQVIRYLSFRIDKEEQLTSLTRMGDDERRYDDREDRRRGGRRGEPFRARGEERRPMGARARTTEPEADFESDGSSVRASEAAESEATSSAEAVEQLSEESR
ncbi:MAG: 30S ribosomal protein S6 [Candidatus Tectomicrobia bacterium]